MSEDLMVASWEIKNAHNTVDVIVDHRIREPGDEVGLVGASLHVAVDVSFHEDCAPLAESDGGAAGKRHVGEFAFYGDVELFGPFFQEAARAGGAGVIHGEVAHYAVLERDVF